MAKFLVEQFASRPKEEKKAFVDAQNEYGNTALHWAALGGHLETVKYLMDQGASPAIPNDQNYIPLDSAGFNNHMTVVDYFLALSSGLESSNQSGLNGAVETVQVDGEEGEPAEEGEENRPT